MLWESSAANGLSFLILFGKNPDRPFSESTISPGSHRPHWRLAPDDSHSRDTPCASNGFYDIFAGTEADLECRFAVQLLSLYA